MKYIGVLRDTARARKRTSQKHAIPCNGVIRYHKKPYHTWPGELPWPEMRQRPGELQSAWKKVAPGKKSFLAIFTCWMVLYGPKQYCMIRAYRCAILDTPLAYIRKKIDPRPPGAQKRAIWPLGGPFSGHRAGFWPRNPFFYRTPDFVNGPSVALVDIFDLAPSDWFLNFLFPSYGPKWPFSAIPQSLV